MRWLRVSCGRRNGRQKAGWGGVGRADCGGTLDDCGGGDDGSSDGDATCNGADNMSGIGGWWAAKGW